MPAKARKTNTLADKNVKMLPAEKLRGDFF